MLGYPQSKQQWETVGTHCCISHSEEIKYIADNSLFIGEVGECSKEQTQKKKRNRKKKKEQYK